MWIRFWYKDLNPCSKGEEESIYSWYNPKESEEALKEYAREMVPDWLEDSIYGFDCGFEKISKPPEEELRDLLRMHYRIVERSVQMIRIIKEALCPGEICYKKKMRY